MNMRPNTPGQWAGYKNAFERWQYGHPEASIQECHEAGMKELLLHDAEHCYACDRPTVGCACGEERGTVSDSEEYTAWYEDQEHDLDIAVPCHAL
jgi:hypothetical protein